MSDVHPHYLLLQEMREARSGRNAIRHLAKAFSRQINVIFALMIREMKVRYGRSSLGYAMAFISPAIQKGLLIALMIAANRHPPIGTSMVLFYWVGLSSYHMFGFVTNKIIASLKEFKKVRVLPTIVPLDYAIMRAMLEASTNLIVSGVGLVLSYLFESELACPGQPIYVIQSLFLMGMLGFGVGLINATISVFFPTYKLIWGSVSIIMMITSGLFIVPDEVPYQMRQYMEWNPLTHGIELYRMGFYPNYYTGFVDVQYLAYWSFSALFLGLMLERVMRRRVINHK